MNAKLQFNGLAAMFKVLFPQETATILTENELVSYVNLVHRISNSVKWYHEWREYEQREYFWKTLVYCAVWALILILFIIAVLLFLRKPKKTGENMPLVNKIEHVSSS